MDPLPRIIETVRLPFEMTLPSYLSDHRVNGRVVLPAVEAMQQLARAVKAFRADVDVTVMAAAGFHKFLFLESNPERIDAYVDIQTLDNGDIAAALLTKRQAKTASMTRMKVHAALRYPHQTSDAASAPIDLNAALEGVSLALEPRKIYRELVPFGPAYHNLRHKVFVSPRGALAEIESARAGAPPETPCPLGSPFPLDAAYHAACVWGQRYAQTVAFPVGFDRRCLVRPTSAAEPYYGRIVPIRTETGALVVDIFILDRYGRLCEYSQGVRMRDVSAGRIVPPRWIMANQRPNPLEHISACCSDSALIELKTLMPFAEKALSGPERRRFDQLGVRRRRSFLSARLACKRIARRRSAVDRWRAADEITTLAVDGVRPACPRDTAAGIFCSVSHDDRFAVAVAGDRRLGVDVERISRRALRAGRIYMSHAEQVQVKQSELGEAEAAVRVWTIKEAAAKALDISLADAWRRVQVLRVGRDVSAIRIDGDRTAKVVHDVVGRHIFTVVRVA